jgi:hypothetical protein
MGIVRVRCLRLEHRGRRREFVFATTIIARSKRHEMVPTPECHARSVRPTFLLRHDEDCLHLLTSEHE